MVIKMYDNLSFVNLKKDIAIMVKEERLKRDMTVEELGEKASVSEQTIYDIEAAKFNVRCFVLFRIEKVLELDLNEYIKNLKVK